MSTRRQLFNEESYEEPEALFISLAERDPALIDSDTVWRQLIESLWFRREVEIQAAQLVDRSKLCKQICDDIAQQVVVALKHKLSKNGNLRANARKLRGGHFPGWMGNIIRRCIIDILRGEGRHAHPPLTEEEEAVSQLTFVDLRLDLTCAINKLEPREQEVARLWFCKWKMRDICEDLGLTRRQVQLSLKKIFEFLRRALAIYRTSK